MGRTLTEVMRELAVKEQEIIRAKADEKIKEIIRQASDNQKEDTQSKNPDTK
jgi:hypothetical protein